MELPAGYTQRKHRVVLVCVLAYLVSYLCRTNLSIAMDDLLAALSITRSQAGLISTLYFWTYASGQLLGGWLCQKWDPKRVVLLGMIGTGACNLLIGFSSHYLAVLLLWTLNGLALALFWPPILQITTNWVESSEYVTISILLCLPTTLGYLLAWSSLGALRGAAGWRWVFFAPAALAFAYCFVWLAFLEPSPRAAGFSYTPQVLEMPDRDKASTGEAPSLWRSLFTLSMLSSAVMILAQGSTKESINLWAPTLLNDLAGADGAAFVSLFTSLIPLFSTAGLLVTGWLVRRLKGGQDLALMVLTAAGALAGWLVIALRGSLSGTALCIGLMLGLVYGANVILTLLLPLRFVRTGQSAAFTSIFNFLAYVGAALGGLVSGWVSDVWGWESVCMLWAALCTLCLAVLLISEVWQYLSWRWGLDLYFELRRERKRRR